MVKATLKFENAGTINVEYPVAAIGAAAPGAPASEGGMKMESHGGMKQMDRRADRPVDLTAGAESRSGF
jgi:hypothetical protein